MSTHTRTAFYPRTITASPSRSRLQTKRVRVGHRTLTLYSRDGTLWSSDRTQLAELDARREALLSGRATVDKRGRAITFSEQRHTVVRRGMR